MNKLNIKQVEETQGGSMTSFCAGFIAGSAFAYSVGFSTGPIGIGLVLTASVYVWQVTAIAIDNGRRYNLSKFKHTQIILS